MITCYQPLLYQDIQAILFACAVVSNGTNLTQEMHPASSPFH